jgi:hypothetical protein
MDLARHLDQLLLAWARSEMERKFHAANSARLRTEITEVNKLLRAARSQPAPTTVADST